MSLGEKAIRRQKQPPKWQELTKLPVKFADLREFSVGGAMVHVAPLALIRPRPCGARLRSSLARWFEP
jgi:hypothetical protein